MKEFMNQKSQIPFETFHKELEKEFQFHKEGSSYRRETAQLSLIVANEVGDVVTFLDRDNAKQAVSRVIPGLDHHRSEDVAKMLFIIARDLSRKGNLSTEMKQYLQQKRIQQKPLSFIQNKFKD